MKIRLSDRRFCYLKMVSLDSLTHGGVRGRRLVTASYSIKLRVSEIIPQPLAGYKKRGTLALCRRAQRYISGHNTTAMRPLGRYGTDVCLRHCLFLYPAGATGFLKAFQNAELPAYAVPCRRCLSEDVDIFQKSAERQGESGHDVRVSRLSTWMSTVGGPVMTRTTHHFSQKIHIRRPYIETCVSHAPGVRLA